MAWCSVRRAPRHHAWVLQLLRMQWRGQWHQRMRRPCTFSLGSKTMHLRPIVLGTVLVVLASPPGLALAQGRRHGMGMQGGMSHDRGARQQLGPVLQRTTDNPLLRDEGKL